MSLGSSNQPSSPPPASSSIDPSIDAAIIIITNIASLDDALTGQATPPNTYKRSHQHTPTEGFSRRVSTPQPSANHAAKFISYSVQQKCLSYDTSLHTLATGSVPLHSTYTSKCFSSRRTSTFQQRVLQSQSFQSLSPPSQPSQHPRTPPFQVRLAGPVTFLHSLPRSNNDFSEQVLTSTFSDFVIYENRRPPFYTFHRQKAIRALEECFRNPTSAAKLANAVHNPTSTTTTTNKPTISNALISNLMVRHNNPFND
ncbi:hypothetical protein PENSOL_c009G10488 [Penicillium solitum]|uniref:Uncharacterized protein n=1 Tax=Penicillium solitum TaxID=60172 RepID=A0A1V6RAV3_9EURO|nr:uncharacterized protein PENSOL_c009G10488 [Penicillium solitum]OQD98302.1 hypothetical protein PENSOL_c009G10488 [Penicillium solitum]